MPELTPQQDRKRKRLAKLVDDGELAILDHLLEIEDRLDEFNVNNILDQIKGKDSTVPGPQGPEGPVGPPGDTIVGPPGPKGDSVQGPSGKDGISIVGDPGKDGSPDTGAQIVNKINELPIEEEFQIEIEHIKGWEDKIKLIAGAKGPVIHGGIVGRDLIKDIDLSDQLNGVLKTFNIQAIWNVVSVNLSSYPYGSLRKGIDYTYGNTSITFTATIDAATQLSVGQQCIVTVIAG